MLFGTQVSQSWSFAEASTSVTHCPLLCTSVPAPGVTHKDVAIVALLPAVPSAPGSQESGCLWERSSGVGGVELSTTTGIRASRPQSVRGSCSHQTPPPSWTVLWQPECRAPGLGCLRYCCRQRWLPARQSQGSGRQRCSTWPC